MRLTHRFFSRWQNWLGLLLVFFFIAVAIAAPVLSPQDPENPGTVKIVGSIIDFTPKPPSSTAPLGTLSKSISVYHSLVWGTRSALTFGLLVVALTSLIGALVGASSAYFGGFLNNFLMRIADSFLAFPMIAAVVFITQLITIWLNNVGVTYFAGWAVDPYHSANSMIVVPPNLPWIYFLLMKINPVMVAFILFSWMPYARLMNTSVTQIKNTEYIVAAKSIGARPLRIIFKHLLPNAITPVIVMAAKDVGGVVLLQATFTFIGLGGDSPWGALLASGRDWIINPGGILTYWWAFLPATLALILFGMGWNLLGDGLNDALNPREN